ncbi:BLUF domain-containing protein [Catenuloplanes indicus]|uniref:BLUF domain-containing protein n=1 Tax=Catenuloplanes indicus TaxID=137267 RepID=A0AAE4AVS7_9ACTN|nr:BLUF domain-containing protein [Catenuloplanes indicus]MDQ0364294.1 hypothetical protein [Catenuloplanes indicus]
MGMTQLIYRSRQDRLPAESIFNIRDQARENNARLAVTGVLLFSPEHFLQCLEGEAEQVTRTFRIIAEDPRHDRISLLSVRDVPQRSFPDWSMGLVDTGSASIREAVGDVLPADGFAPDRLGTDQVTTLMQRLRTLQQTY